MAVVTAALITSVVLTIATLAYAKQEQADAPPEVVLVVLIMIAVQITVTLAYARAPALAQAKIAAMITNVAQETAIEVDIAALKYRVAFKN